MLTNPDLGDPRPAVSETPRLHGGGAIHSGRAGRLRAAGSQGVRLQCGSRPQPAGLAP